MKCIKCNEELNFDPDEAEVSAKPAFAMPDHLDVGYQHECGQRYYTFVPADDLVPVESDEEDGDE